MKIPEGLKLRMKNKTFWASMISAIIVAIQLVFKLFGIDIDLSAQQEILLELLNVVFIILILLGVVINPTTPGITDSAANGNKDPTVVESSGEISSDNKVE